MYRYLGVLQKVFEQHQSFDGFALNGGSTLQSLTHFYGIEIPLSDPHMTVAQYVARRCYGRPRIGDRVALGRRIELTVREIEGGTVQAVGLRILGNLPERRGPWAFEGAHNFMRRSTDQERDRRATPTYQRRFSGFSGLRRSAD